MFEEFGSEGCKGPAARKPRALWSGKLWWCLLCAVLLCLAGCPTSPGGGQESVDESSSGGGKEGTRLDAGGEPVAESTAADARGEASPDASIALPWPDISPPEQEPEARASDTVTPEGSASDAGAADATPAPTCQGRKAQEKRDSRLTLKFDGKDRVYRLHIPPQYDPTKAMPLVVNMHGYSSDSWQQQLLTDMNKHADKHGYLVVYPEGTGLVKAWNAGSCCPPNAARNSDDVGFISALLDHLEKELCVDTRRIFATGMSNGGFMTHRLACELSNRIAAFSPVAGHLLFKNCQPKRPIPLLHFHGTSDAIVPYKGSSLTKFPPVQDSIDFWVKHNGCDTRPNRIYATGDATCDRYESCKDGVTVTLCTIHGGGHTWPGGLAIPAGKTSRDINATDTMWTFFQTFPLPQAPTP